VADVFEEVEEQLRAQQLKTLALRALPWVGGALALALLAALAFWGYDHFRSQQAAATSDQYGAAVEAALAGNAPAAKAALTQVSQKGPAAYRAMALMQLGGAALSDKNIPGAVKLFDDAAKISNDPILGDVARLKSAFALMDTAPYAEIESRLKPLTAEKRPYRAVAREALAFAKLNAGDTAGARGDFVVLSLGQDSTEDARQRAQAAISLIDSGAAKALPAAIKASESLPPLPPAPQGPPQGAQGPAQ
jgi:hypothetical protein